MTRRTLPLLFILLLGVGPTAARAQDFILMSSGLDDALLFGSPGDTTPGGCNFTPSTTQTSLVAGLSDGKVAVLTTDERIVLCDRPGDFRFDNFDLKALIPGIDAEDVCGMSDGRIALLTARNDIVLLSRVTDGLRIDRVLSVPQIVPNTDPVHLACVTNGGFAVSTASDEIIVFRSQDDETPVLIATGVCSRASGNDLAGMSDGRIALLNTEYDGPFAPPGTLTIFDPESPFACPFVIPIVSRCSFPSGFNLSDIVAPLRRNGLLVFNPFYGEFCVLRSPDDLTPVKPPIGTIVPNFGTTHIGGFPFSEGTCACGNGVIESLCGEQCDPGGDVPSDCCTAQCKVVDAGYICRVASGGCDAPEACTGSETICPPDLFKPSTEVCRPAVGVCDGAETCSGAGPLCPPDQLVPSTQACRAAAGDCDVAEICTGTSASCPTDRFLPTTHVCRVAAGDCDLAETCTGASTQCPADAFTTASTACRASAGPCDAAETCTGSAAGCPVNGFRPAGTECRAAAGDCDVADTCTGTSSECPADAFRPSAIGCRAAAGECDQQETCTGTTATCPADARKPASTACASDNNPCTLDQCDGTLVTCQHGAGNPGAICRPATSTCDLAEMCSGTTATCPADAKSRTVCRPAAGTCDQPENCTGSSDNCPADTFKPSTELCRPTAGTCDVAESCPGTGPNCPADVMAPSTLTCRTAILPCDVAEQCDGRTAGCPPDARQPDGTTCNDGQFCTDPDTCQNGTCTGPARACVDGSVCTADQCDEAGDRCVSVPDPDSCNDTNPCTDDACGPSGCTHTAVVGRTCDDGLFCTVGETCGSDGACGGGTPRDCSAAAGGAPCTAGVCDDTVDACVAQSTPTVPGCSDDNPCRTLPDLAACNDLDDCTDDDVCQAASCAGVRKCRVDEPLQSRGTATVVAIEGEPGSKCKVRILEIVGGAASVDRAGGAVALQAAGRQLSGVAKGKIKRSGRLVLRLKLNPLGKKLLRNAPTRRLDAMVEVTIRDPRPGGKVRLLPRLITLVRRR